MNYWYEELLGEKIKDFGNSYSLYKINPKYLRQKFCFIPKDNDGINNCTAIDYEKSSSEMYKVTGLFIEGGDLIMMEPYNPNWNIVLSTKDVVKSLPYMDYYNSWKVDGILNDEMIHFDVVFTPAKYNIYLYLLSTLSLIGSLMYVIRKLKLKL